MAPARVLPSTTGDRSRRDHTGPRCVAGGCRIGAPDPGRSWRQGVHVPPGEKGEHVLRSPRIVAAGTAAAAAAVAVGLSMAHADPAPLAPSSTPIKHVVVIFDENISFDHYFGTYPNAANPPGEPAFSAAADTPSVNGLTADAARQQPERVATPAPRPLRGRDLLAEPRLRRRAAGVRRRPDGQVRRVHRGRLVRRPARQVDRHGLLRRQHRHRAVELRAALRDERQLLQHDTSGRRRPARSTWCAARRTASDAGRSGSGARRTATR